ncbi:KamA family radical SAM protein [bacterium]|nr:KamA family radical SAM protein [bacterium]
MTPEWKRILAESIDNPRDIAALSGLDAATLVSVCSRYPLLINPYVLHTAQAGGPPLLKQVIPDPRELDDRAGVADPLAEERDSPVPLLTHRYPDRVLFLVSGRCASICRFCTRKRKIGRMDPISDRAIENGVDYIRGNDRIRDVLLSGGDPLVLEDDRLAWILSMVRSIPHVETIRIGTRVPCFLPQRITPGLVRVLRRFQPLYVNMHFNHPAEITPEAAAACLKLADAGLPLGSQTVLLRGVNDNASILAGLMRALLRIRVKPYYLLQADLTRGTDHFRTRTGTGLEIMKQMRGHISGMAVPAFVMDLPGGGGKVPLLPDYVQSRDPDSLTLRNYRGDLYTYPEPHTGG